jgi:hypothetical protein
MNVSIHFVDSVKTSSFLFSGLLAVLGLMFFAQPATAGEIPVKIEGKVVFVSAKVNGEGPFTFVLDTGAMISVLTPAAAKKAGLKEKAGSPINPRSMRLRQVWMPPPKNVSGAQPNRSPFAAASSTVSAASGRTTSSPGCWAAFPTAQRSLSALPGR